MTSCAGGLSARIHIPVAYQKAEGTLVLLRLHGLLGGHSGSEIDKEHANAVIEMGRIIKYVETRMQIGVVSLEGGLKDNAIPREVTGKILVPSDQTNEFLQYISEITQILQKEFAVSDPKLSVHTEILNETEEEILSAVSMQKVLFFLRNLPNGVMHMSTNIHGLVETSLNAGILKLSKKDLFVSVSVRSSVGSRKEDLAEKLTYLTEFLGGEISIDGDYPAWEYCADSVLRNQVAGVYREMFGKEPVFEAIHAGLECGMFADKIKGLDAVSFGPDNFDIHTPKERLSISSAERVYRFLTELLRSMK